MLAFANSARIRTSKAAAIAQWEQPIALTSTIKNGCVRIVTPLRSCINQGSSATIQLQ